MLASEEAVSLAMLGDQPGTLAALRRAQDAFDRRDPAADPESLWYFDPAELAYRTGKARLWLARSDPRQAEDALRHSSVAIRTFDDGKARSRAVIQVDLAIEHALVCDPGRAVVEGRRALTAAGQLQSRRLLDWLASLPPALAPHQAANADVRDLIHDIHAARQGSPA